MAVGSECHRDLLADTYHCIKELLGHALNGTMELVVLELAIKDECQDQFHRSIRWDTDREVVVLRSASGDVG